MKKETNTEIYHIPKTKPNGSSKEELYESIVQDIRDQYGTKFSEVEIHQAARNFIEFVRKLMKW